MLHMFAKELKLFISFILASILLLSIILYIRNGTTMVVTINTPNNSLLHTKIYFTNGQENYSEKHTLRPFTSKNNTYYFHFPQFTSIKKLRFDPHNKKTKLTIREIKIIHYSWFKKTVYILPLQNFKMGSQIAHYRYTKKGLSFDSIGNDPNIYTDFLPLKISQTTNFPAYAVVLSIIIVFICLFLLHIYKTYTHNDKLIAKLILYTLFLAFIFFKVNYYKNTIKFGYPPDESVHFTYVQEMHNNYSIVPDFRKMSHYLSHPPLYYQFLDLVYDTKISNKQNIKHFRSLSTLIYITTILLIFYLGFSSNLSILGHFVYVTFISAIPMHAYLGASITNDTLAMFAASIFILGFKRLLEENYHTSTYFIIGLGIFLSFFSKLTVALLLFFAIIFFFIRMFVTKKWIHINRFHIGLLLVFLLPIIYYQLSIILEYHALVPTYNHTHPEAYLKSNFYTPEALRKHLNHAQWAQRMLHYIQGGWFGIHSHHSFGHAHWSGVWGLIILHMLAIITLFINCSKENKTFCVVGKLSLLALFSVLIVQYFFSYQAHVANGYLGGLQPRYLLPFMFAFAIMASLFVERFKKIFIFQIFIIIVCIQALYSDFFYFLNYYA